MYRAPSVPTSTLAMLQLSILISLCLMRKFRGFPFPLTGVWYPNRKILCSATVALLGRSARSGSSPGSSGSSGLHLGRCPLGSPAGPTYNTTVLLLKNKTKKPKQKGKRLFGVSFLVGDIKAFKRSSGARVWPPVAPD